MSQKKLSLQEQLVKSGLTSDAKAKQIRSEKHKQSVQIRCNNAQIVNEAKLLAQKTKAEQLQKDKALNLQNQAAAEQKALETQIKQLIELNRQPMDTNGSAFHFNDHNKVKTIYVSEAMRQAIITGYVAIVKYEQHYEVVPAEIAQKLKLRDAGCIMLFNETSQQTSAGNDPYAEFVIPDDLMW